MNKSLSKPFGKLLLRISFFVFLMTTISHSQTKYPTNAAVISNGMSLKFIDELNNVDKNSSGIHISADQTWAMNVWLAKILTDSCVAANYLVYSAPDSSNELIVTISDANAKITYKKSGRKWLFFKPNRKRSIETNAHLELKKQNKILVRKQINFTYEDVLPKNAIKAIESDEIPFLKGTEQQNSVIKRWIEPVLITAATTTVVYLFFSLRSEN